jgi:hypothetical protein
VADQLSDIAPSVCYIGSSPSVLQQPSAPPTLISKLPQLATMAVQRLCCLCPLPCRGDRAPFRLDPAGNKEGTYSHDRCIRAEKKKRAAAEVALAQPGTDAGANGAAIASVMKKQKTDAADADADATARGAATADKHSCGEARSSLLPEEAAVPAAASSPSSNAAAAAELLFALHTRYILNSSTLLSYAVRVGCFSQPTQLCSPWPRSAFEF